MRKPIKVIILHPERLSINLTNAIADIYEEMLSKNVPMPWETKAK